MHKYRAGSISYRMHLETSMKSFFAVDGPLINFLTKTGQLIILTVLWLICSIPVFTIASAGAAFYYAVIKSVRREVGYPAKEFFRCFKLTLKKGAAVSVILALWTYLLWVDISFISRMEDRMHLVMYIGIYAMAFLSISACVYLFPVMSRFDVSIKKWIKMSLSLMIRRLRFTVVLAGSILLRAWLAFFYMPIVCIVVIPGVWTYLATFLMEPALKLYMPKPEEGQPKEWFDE